MKNQILITGGAGFIGSHVCETLFKKFNKSSFIIIDKLTYASDKKYLTKILKSDNVKFYKLDICNFQKMKPLFIDVVIAINIAAESHVDKSFNNSFEFTRTNTLGTHVFLECCKQHNVKKIYQISTDEVYGEKLTGSNNENDKLSPTNPYAASKAAAEMIINSYNESFKSKITVIRANNIFGIRQYPEKIIPYAICSILRNTKINIHGNGHQTRCFLHVDDFTSGLIKIITNGALGEIYNIGSSEEIEIKKLTKLICDKMNVKFTKHTRFITDRPFNDFRYSVSFKKLKNLEWSSKKNLDFELDFIIDWYRSNYKKFYKNQ